MSNLNRISAVNTVAALCETRPEPASPANISFYGQDVFSRDAMQQYLSKATAEKLIDTIDNGAPLDPSIAADVAHAMKHWAMERGATHFTHWFLPLTGSTAEKHDSFLEIKNGQAITAFSAKNLIVSEPDASSFPSGGLRCTFEARGYTAWDPTSPAFIKRHANGATLCIPTVFCSYTGEALDRKTPLLRSMQVLRAAVKRLMKNFGFADERVSITLGAEQEYFLIDKHFYLHRPDLIQTGRTVFGAPPAKHQQLEDHYFGSIKMRILNCMTEVEHELWKLGIPAKTRHNEVAPAQYELAPIFEDMNLACDHNMLVMEMLREVADRHGLVCLLHEKPFAGVNGSGKHNNWSVNYGNINLLEPGKDPQQNAIFLTMMTAIIEAVDTHSALLRDSVIGAGNDHRLGANEAPPAIISIYLGDQLTEVIEQVGKESRAAARSAGSMRVGVDTLPPLPKDATDRNRTSPFAFTGNKFEFRSPGSSQSCSGPCVVLNTIVADSVNHICDEMEKFGKNDFNRELQKLLSKIICDHKRIIFNGNGYTQEWQEEAARRGLPNTPTSLESLSALVSSQTQDLFNKYGVYNIRELESRHEVFQEDILRRISIEGGIALEIAKSMILPVARAEFGKLVDALEKCNAAHIQSGKDTLTDNANMLGDALDRLNAKIRVLEKALATENGKVREAMDALRLVVDELESQLPNEAWPLPKYREMLFLY
ncbi:MAG: glutamine synthetase III [Lentisphaeria bacterium]|nr:glutamine synthetase III [Lentisphaeria bacterium]